MKKHIGKFWLLSLALAVVFSGATLAQTGTPHGFLITITPGVPPVGASALQGFYLFQCVPSGTVTCASTNAANWIAVGALIPATSQTAGTNYLVPAASLAVGTTYNYEAESVDVNGDYSPWATSVLALSVPASGFPVNPASPSCAGKLQ